VRRINSGLKIPGLRWWIVALIFAATLLSYIDRLTLSVLAPTICSDLHLSNLQYAGISVWFLFAYSIAQTLFGKLQDRIGTRIGLGIAMTIWSIAEMAQAATRGLFSLSAYRSILGLGEGGHWPAAIKGVAEWFPVKERAFGMGIVNTGATLGSALAPPLIVWLELSFGWRATFLATGALGFVWLALWVTFYRAPQKHPRLGAGELALIESGASKYAQSIRPSWRLLLKNRQVLGIVLARFLGDPVWWLYLVWLPLYLFHARGLTLREIGASAWVPFLCADGGALLGGWFSGWLVQRGWNLLRARTAAIVAAAVIAPVGIFIAGVRSEAEAIALIGIVLFAFQFWVNNVQTLTSDLFSNDLVASISGLAGTAAGVGAMIFIFSTGWIVDHFGYSPVLMASSVLIPAATIALVWLARGTSLGSGAEELRPQAQSGVTGVR